ncbi:uncharacterized protein DSM5745_06938 [Aspergillus mulundensis]|uniref:Uncharacterized protein n=1 Tax=Aspergillus mulundensis TaxID=1810919 RepID=A0A3D8RK05_9EURO|nr:Uncharacterized protein DSM5745_06938 [Aspergillus mulundensis]RDW74276.1 Uncharacterized protein DSM5745_06938 [Aspergillus mulundensis]
MADKSPSLIPFLGAMTAAQKDATYSSGRGPVAPYANLQDMAQDPYPPQSYHTRKPSRSIHIDLTGWEQKAIPITEGGPGGAVLYTADLTRSTSQMRFFAGQSQTTLATVNAQAPNSRIAVNMHGHNITMHITTRLRKEAKYGSPSLQNAPMTWKSQSMKVVDFELRDGNAIPLAQFNPHPSWSRREAGRLDLFGPSVSSGRLMEEIVVTAVALVHSTNIQLEEAAGGPGPS